MTTDERLDRLTERHETLTETVQLLAADMRQMIAENRERDRKWDARWMDIAEAIARLAKTAHAHEQRISDLENNK
jgi:hypothetical protein